MLCRLQMLDDQDKSKQAFSGRMQPAVLDYQQITYG
jgi:hypothetical protein